MPKSKSFEIADKLLMQNLSFLDIFDVLSTPETMNPQIKIEFSKRKLMLHFFCASFF